MFDFLKKKVFSLTEKLKKSIEKKKETTAVQVKKEEQGTFGFEPEKKRELKAKVGIAKKIAGAFTGTITISQKDLQGFSREFELSLLEADVEAQTAREIVSGIEQDFAGKKIFSKQDVSGFLRQELKKVLLKVMETKKIDFFKKVKSKKPFVVLFLGPNGAGKTTSIAKIANLLKKNGRTVALCASDTFRAASIEQLQVHAKALNLKIIKHDYGADPAAVAFDAIAFSKAKKIDVVLIDSAGRQETNKNLIEELKKIERVAKPDLKIFVGESYSGQMLLKQAKEFNEAMNFDGFILTKIDVDSKGGGAISLLHSLKKPVLFVGVGQGYDDLVEFEPEFIVEKIV